MTTGLPGCEVFVEDAHPLLTKDQLIDWLIYHVPMEEGGDDDRPFIVEYRPKKVTLGWSIRVFEETPWDAYDKLAEIMMIHQMHHEVTELYWYWTI